MPGEEVTADEAVEVESVVVAEDSEVRSRSLIVQRRREDSGEEVEERSFCLPGGRSWWVQHEQGRAARWVLEVRVMETVTSAAKDQVMELVKMLVLGVGVRRPRRPEPVVPPDHPSISINLYTTIDLDRKLTCDPAGPLKILVP